MTNIVLTHNSYNQSHLEMVKAEMINRGTPTIRGFYNESNGVWLAVEGCHRLRAAYQLGLTPIMRDISNQKTLTYQEDGETIKVRLNDAFCSDWYDQTYRNTQLNFNDEEDNLDD